MRSVVKAQLELAVTQGVVDPSHGGPELAARQEPGRGESRLLTGVRVRPLTRDHLRLRVRGHLQRVVLRWPDAILDLLALRADGDHRVAEAVKLGLVLRLGGLHHQRMGHRPGHRGRVEAVVLKALGDVLLDNASRPPQVRAVNDELVRAAVVLVGGNDLVVALQPRLHVVSVEDGVLRGVGEALLPEHRAEHPRDARNASLTPRRSGHGAEVTARGRLHDAVVRQVRRQVLTHADGAQTRATATMRDAEGLVKVQVADISTNHAGRRQAELRVHVSTIHVDLAAVVVHDLADLLDVVLEEGTRGRVRHHEGREVVLVLLAHLPEFLDVHALGIVDPLDLHVAHGRRSRVGAVRGPRNDADVAVALALLLLVLTDGQQASVLSGRATGRLKGAGIEAGAADEVLLKALEQLPVASRVAVGGEGVHVADLGPAARRQRGDGVQLHSAGAKGDHGLVKGQVLQLEVEHVAHHLGLGVDAVEDVLLQKRPSTRERRGELAVNGDIGGCVGGAATETRRLDGIDERHDVGLQVRLVEARGHPLVVEHRHVELLAL
mmetsp:Transcript_20295/g.51765  ORF Transcript_20295/g.51765 Transcript_20295/m.51765 type:complete len:551 (-) Transcript_20295:115-1767(-)